jgi:hypothetical protein
MMYFLLTTTNESRQEDQPPPDILFAIQNYDILNPPLTCNSLAALSYYRQVHHVTELLEKRREEKDYKEKE